MRERTPFPRTLFAALPKLKLLITSGMRNAAIDMEAAKDHKVVLCGTQFGRDPTAPLTMGLILELTRNIGRENARMHAGEPLQKSSAWRSRAARSACSASASSAPRLRNWRRPSA